MSTARLSVIVPAYNESEVIRDCLARLLGEIDSIHEVLVVDNNSSDDTRSIVDEFAAVNPKFSVIFEKEQGLIPARDTGFDSATGEILARIDADTRVGEGWADAVAAFFAAHGDDFEGGSGLCSFYDAPFQERFRRRHDELTAQMLARPEVPREHNRLFGSNMAITAKAWGSIRTATSRRDDVFEDLDIALCLRSLGARVGLIPGADVTISGRRFRTGPISQIRYCLCDQRTYKIHGRASERRGAILTMILVTLPFYSVMYLPFRLYDPDTGTFSISALWRKNRAGVRAHA